MSRAAPLSMNFRCDSYGTWRTARSSLEESGMVPVHRCVQTSLLSDPSHLVSLLSSAAFPVNVGVVQGWTPRWDDTGTVLRCVPELKSTQHRSIIIAVVVASAAVLLVAVLVWRQYLRTRPRWLRERMLQVSSSYSVASNSPPWPLLHMPAAWTQHHAIIPIYEGPQEDYHYHSMTPLACMNARRFLFMLHALLNCWACPGTIVHAMHLSG